MSKKNKDKESKSLYIPRWHITPTAPSGSYQDGGGLDPIPTKEEIDLTQDLTEKTMSGSMGKNTLPYEGPSGHSLFSALEAQIKYNKRVRDYNSLLGEDTYERAKLKDFRGKGQVAKFEGGGAIGVSENVLAAQGGAGDAISGMTAQESGGGGMSAGTFGMLANTGSTIGTGIIDYNSRNAATDRMNNKDVSRATGKSALSGMAKGASTGAQIGSVVPGIGTVIGGVVGAVGGLVAGAGMGNIKAREQQKEMKDSLMDRYYGANGGKLPEPSTDYYAYGGMLEYRDGGIYVKPDKRNTFNAAAKTRNLDAQSFASSILGNSEDIKPFMTKRANGGPMPGDPPEGDEPLFVDPTDVYEGGPGWEDYLVWREKMNQYESYQAEVNKMKSSGYDLVGDVPTSDFESQRKANSWDKGFSVPETASGVTKFKLTEGVESPDYTPADSLGTGTGAGSNQYIPAFNKPEGSFNVVKSPAEIKAEEETAAWDNYTSKAGVKGFYKEWVPQEYDASTGTTKPGYYDYTPTDQEGTGGNWISSDRLPADQREKILQTSSFQFQGGGHLSEAPPLTENTLGNFKAQKKKRFGLSTLELEGEKHRKNYGGGLPMKSGGMMYQDGGQLEVTEYNGPRHENGGIAIGPNAEVEGGEVRVEDYIFSDTLSPEDKGPTFAKLAKKINKKYEERPADGPSERAKKKELGALMKANEMSRQKEDYNKAAEETTLVRKYGGMIQYKNGGVLIDKSNRDEFTKAAKDNNMAVHEFAANIMRTKKRMGGKTSYSNGGKMSYETGGKLGGNPDKILGDRKKSLEALEAEQAAIADKINNGKATRKEIKRFDNISNERLNLQKEITDLEYKIESDPNNIDFYEDFQSTAFNEQGQPISTTSREGLPIMRETPEDFQLQPFQTNEGPEDISLMDKAQVNPLYNPAAEVEPLKAPEELKAGTSSTNTSEDQQKKMKFGREEAALLASNLPGIQNLMSSLSPEITTFDRVDPELIDLSKQRQLTADEAAMARKVARGNVRGNAKSSGEALSALSASSAAITRNKMQTDLQSYLSEETTNAQIENQAENLNTQITNQEIVANEQNRAMADSLAGLGLSDLSNNFQGYFRDKGLAEENERYNKQTISLVNEMFPNYKWNIDPDQDKYMIEFVNKSNKPGNIGG